MEPSMSQEQEDSYTAQTLKNTTDIGALTAQVTKLATMFQYETERAKEERSGVKDMVTELKGVNEKLTTLANVQKDVSTNTSRIAELATRVDQLKEWKDKYDLSKFDSRIGALEKTGQIEEGAAKAISTGADWFWRIFGPVATAAIMAVMYLTFHQSPPAYTDSTIIQHSSHGPITGE